MQKIVDFLVVGSGIAGLSYALKVAHCGKVCIVTKSKADDTATRYAQGGIASVMYNPDTYEKHIRDTLIAGDDLCNEEVVRLTVMESTERINELIEMGVSFDKTPGGLFDLSKEGGHSEYRVLHHKDQTGAELEKVLLDQIHKHPNIEILENYFTIDIITQHHLGVYLDRKTPDITCFGAYVLEKDTNTIHTILAKTTMISTGGAGNAYSVTTNPAIATGDGIAMVYRAKGTVENMEFIQFHPTSLYYPVEKPAFLITEALRGSGAVLRDLTGKTFMEKYDHRKSLAPRDIVARALDNELKISGEDYVYLDARELGKDLLLSHFPGIYAKCLSIGIDINKEMIPVAPAAHYLCGGIKVDTYSRSSILNCYASGECASTGLHGANRLASNSLLESLVFSHRAAQDACERFHSIQIPEGIPDWNAEGTVLNEEMVLVTQTLKELQSIMTSYVGIVRSNLRLKRATDRLNIIFDETEELFDRSVLTDKICELRNLINVSWMIIRFAQRREESRGLHYNIDYPRSEKLKF